jgi:hypothetical protein
VIRLGDFSPFVLLLTQSSLGSFSKITDAAQIFYRIFFHGKRRVLILSKNGSCHNLGDFFKNTSVYPDPEQNLSQFEKQKQGRLEC